MRAFASIATASVLMMFGSAAATADVIYVHASAPSGGDGTSWATAFNDLQDGLAASTPGSGDQLWLVAGTYKPTGPGGDRAISFNIVSGTAIYGGFTGTETKLEERDPAVNITIFSGDLNGNDTGPVDDPTHSENSYHVVKATNTISGTLMDGLKITSGLANGSSPHGSGGGISVSASVFEIVGCDIDANFAQASGGGLVANSSTLTLRNCRFHDNVSLNGPGGGLLSNFGDIFIYDCEFIANEVRRGGFGRAGGAWIWGGTIELTRCLFESNTSPWQTGGLELEEGSARIVDCRFVGNTAVGYGPGGLLSFASVEVIDCQFVDNHGAIAGGAAGVVEHPLGPARFVNCLFAGNSAYRGGAIYMQEANAEFINCVVDGNTSSGYGGGIYVTGHASLKLCTIVGNTAHEQGGGVNRFTSGSTVNVSNSILWDNTDPSGDGEAAQLFNGLGTGTIQFSAVQGWTGALGGVGNFGLNPQFVDADGPDNDVGTEDDNLRLSAASPCRDVGDRTLLPADTQDLDGDTNIAETLSRDLDLLRRIVNSQVDMGAYEWQRTCLTDISPSAPGMAGDGNTNIGDLLAVIAGWGPCDQCNADVNNDDVVNITDLLAVIAGWGACP